MGLLKSVDNVPGIDYYEYRDNQFYNKYEYRLRMEIPCSRYTYWCNKPEELDLKIAGKGKKYYTIRKQDVNTVIDNLSGLKELIVISSERKKKSNYTIRMEGESVAFFANDLSILQDFQKRIGLLYEARYTQVQTAQYAGIKHFVNDPKHKYRVYLKSKRVDDSFHVEFREMCKKQPSLHPSPALKRWLYNDGKSHGIWYFRWASSAHFIDYDDESTLSYLALMYGDVLGKKYKLEKRPDNI